MDATIIAAIIGAVAAIIVALLRWLQWRQSKQREGKSSRPYNNMAAAFKLGFYSVELTYLSKWEKISHVGRLFDADLEKCRNLSRSVGIEFPSYRMGMETDNLFAPLHVSMETIDPQIRSCFRVGMHCGVAYYWRFSVAASLKSSGSLSVQELAKANDLLANIDDDVHEAKCELENIGLSNKLLKPIASYFDDLRGRSLAPEDIGQSGNVMDKLINEAATQLAAQKYT